MNRGWVVAPGGCGYSQEAMSLRSAAMRISTLNVLMAACDSTGPLPPDIQADRYLLQAERAVLECGTKRAPARRWSGWKSSSKCAGWSRRGKTITAMRKSGRRRWQQVSHSPCR